jgi:hypothetical protein
MNILTKQQFDDSFPKDEFHVLLFSPDTYDEFSLLENVKKTKPLQLCAISIQLAIVGFGNKTYGKVKYNDVEIDIKSFFDENNIHYKLRLNEKIEPNEITPRRLIRLFRFKIFQYLKQNELASSYLYRKYCQKKNSLLRQWIFPGVEHILEPEQENIEIILNAFIKTYRNLDTRLNTNICERVSRVLYARGFSTSVIDKIINERIDDLQ